MKGEFTYVPKVNLGKYMPAGSGHGKIFSVGDLDCHILYDGARSVGAMTDDLAERFIFGDAPE